MKVTKFILDNVRCFKGRHEFDIRPLTFITGGNSTGKSTILACWQIMANFLREQNLNFNKSPYSLGTFDEIVCKSEIMNEEFSIGISVEMIKDISTYTLLTVFRRKENDSVPVAREFIETLELCGKTAKLKTEITNDVLWKMNRFGASHMIGSNILNKDISEVTEDENEFLELALQIVKMLESGEDLKYLDETDETDEESMTDEKKIRLLFSNCRNTIVYTRSMGPLRTKPRRTYDRFENVDYSQLEEFPMLLLELLDDKETSDKTKETLNKFGINSGMFESIGIKKFSDSDSDPFQIAIRRMNSLETTLVDIGFGTSQVLPIMVRVIFGRKYFDKVWYQNYLIMQPEVHLHPKGQAELISFFVNECGVQKPIFIIETHSDFMVERAVIEVKNKNLSEDDLSLIYLDFDSNGEVQTSMIDIDEMGNVSNPPPGYREFFLHETNRYLGLE